MLHYFHLLRYVICIPIIIISIVLRQHILKCRILNSPKRQVKSSYRLSLPLLESKSREVSSVLRVLCANRRQRPLILSLVLGAKFPTVLYTSMYPAKRLQLSVSLEINFLPVRYQLRSRVVFPRRSL